MSIRQFMDIVESVGNPSIQRLRAVVPAKLVTIPDHALLDAYQTLRSGHALDKVRSIAPRTRVETLDAMSDSLQKLAREFQSGTIGLYRTIQIHDGDPEGWVRTHLTKSTHLGIHWSFTEHYVMQHAEDERVMFYAMAGIPAVDWASTVVLNADGVEDEVRLLAGAEIKLIWSDPDGGITPTARQYA